MKLKYIIILTLFSSIYACTQNSSQSDEKAEMYEASELSSMMREMVEWSKESKALLALGDTIKSVPAKFYELGSQKATRGEHEEKAFQAMVPLYTEALRGIERGDSQQYYYEASIQACKSCHSTYCGGPMAIIEQL